MGNLILYENVVIGSFLFEVGMRIGRLRPALPILSVNLLQQTGVDQIFGDLLLANAATCRLIEFKRERNTDSKEPTKRDRLLEALIEQDDHEYWFTISRRTHWYASIDESRIDEAAFETSVVPYIDLQRREQFKKLDSFASLIAEEACGEPNAKRAKENLSYLRGLSGVFSKTKAGGTSPVFLIATFGNGRVGWLVSPDLGYLFKEARELHEALGVDIQPPKQQYGYGYSY